MYRERRALLRIALSAALLALGLAGCGGPATTVPVTFTETLRVTSPTTVWQTATATLTQATTTTVTISSPPRTVFVTTTVAPPPAASATTGATAAPTASVPPGATRFYRLRFELTTTSDWSALIFPVSADILAVRAMQTTGTPRNVSADLGRVFLGQPLEQAGQAMGITVDLALSPAGVNKPFALEIDKGYAGAATVRVSAVTGEDSRLLGEFTHKGVAEPQTEKNARF